MFSFPCQHVYRALVKGKLPWVVAYTMIMIDLWGGKIAGFLPWEATPKSCLLKVLLLYIYENWNDWKLRNPNPAADLEIIYSGDWILILSLAKFIFVFDLLY